MTYLSTKETAYELEVSSRTIERWRTEGLFTPESRTAGGQFRYSKEQVELAKKGIFNGKPAGHKPDDISTGMKELMS